MAKARRIHDLPIVMVNTTQWPYMLGEGMVSDAAGMVPYQRGGYRRVPLWAAHFLASAINANASFCGMSPAGPIQQGGTAQITAAVNITGGNSTQYRILANGTGEAWGGPSQLGSAQNMPARVRYWRKGQKELTVGWNPVGIGYPACMVIESRQSAGNIAYLGAEPMSHSGVTAAGSGTGGQLGPGWVRVYLAFVGGCDAGNAFIGCTDHDVNIDCQLTGTGITNKITLGSIPGLGWSGTTHVYIYRTKVVGHPEQLAYETAYLEKSVVIGTAAADIGLISDAVLVTHAELEIGRYPWPYAKQNNKWLPNLGIGEYQGRLLIWGAGCSERLHISGYIDNDGAAAYDDSSWAFTVDLPGRDTIVGCASLGRKLIILGENGIYTLRDDSDLPDTWEAEQIAAIRSETVDGFIVSGDNVFVVGRDAWGEHNIYACTGYEMKRIADPIRRIVGAHKLINVDGAPMLAGSGDGDKRILYPQGQWGRLNAPSACQWSVGRCSTFQSGALLLGNAAGVYYEGTTYSSDESDFIDSREFILDEEEYSEWEKVYIHAVKLGAEDVTAAVYGSADGGTWTSIGTITIDDAERGIYEVGLPSETMRLARRIKIRIAFTAAQPCSVTGITIQGKPTERRYA